MSTPYPGLDGHAQQSRPSLPSMYNSPEEIQKSVSELIQRLEKEKVANEELAKSIKI